MTSQEKKPRKNKKSQFEIELKRYLSSLSARGDKFIYCNIPAFPGLIIITNADFSLITKYEPVTLSMHLIYTKENTTYNFYDDFMEFFILKIHHYHIFLEVNLSCEHCETIALKKHKLSSIPKAI